MGALHPRSKNPGYAYACRFLTLRSGCTYVNT